MRFDLLGLLVVVFCEAPASEGDCCSESVDGERVLVSWVQPLWGVAADQRLGERLWCFEGPAGEVGDGVAAAEAFEVDDAGDLMVFGEDVTGGPVAVEEAGGVAV